MESLIVGPVRGSQAPFLEISEPDWHQMVAAIRDAFFALQRYAQEHEDGGRAIVVSSPAAVRPIAGMTLEATAGAFLTTVAQVAAIELGEQGITANVVVPAQEPDARALDAVITFLGSTEAAGVTGSVIAADGGFTLTKGG